MPKYYAYKRYAYKKRCIFGYDKVALTFDTRRLVSSLVSAQADDLWLAFRVRSFVRNAKNFPENLLPDIDMILSCTNAITSWRGRKSLFY